LVSRRLALRDELTLTVSSPLFSFFRFNKGGVNRVFSFPDVFHGTLPFLCWVTVQVALISILYLEGSTPSPSNMVRENKHLEIVVKGMFKLTKQIESTIKTLVWFDFYHTVPTDEELESFNYKEVLKFNYGIELQ